MLSEHVSREFCLEVSKDSDFCKSMGRAFHKAGAALQNGPPP